MRNGIPGLCKLVIATVVLAAAVAACDLNDTARRAIVDRRSDDPTTALKRAAQAEGSPTALDVVRRRIWVLRSEGVALHDATTAERLASIALPGWMRVSELYAPSPDVALMPTGDLLVTSNVVAAVWRIDSASFEVTRHDLTLADDRGRDIGFAGLAPLRDGTFLALDANDGALWWIDASLVRAARIVRAVAPSSGCSPPRSAAPLWPGVPCLDESGQRPLEFATDHRAGRLRAKPCCEGDSVDANDAARVASQR